MTYRELVEKITKQLQSDYQRQLVNNDKVENLQSEKENVELTIKFVFEELEENN